MFVRPFLILCTFIIAFSSQAQAQSCDESWDVDKAALRQIFANFDRYLARPEPIVINLKALGASQGQLLVVFARRDLQCIRQLYESKSTGSGTISICKRPKC